MPRFLLSETFFIPFIRVEEYIRCGKDKNIVDPDPNGLYTKRKRPKKAAYPARVLISHTLTMRASKMSPILRMDGALLWKNDFQREEGIEK